MSAFPDCRNDESYNEDFLNEQDKRFIEGFDFAIEVISNLFKDNLSVFEEELTNVSENDEMRVTRRDFYDILVQNNKVVDEVLQTWSEMERDEIITSMLDSMSEAEYQENKEKALEENAKRETPKQYFDTRSFDYLSKQH